ncbi:hypothetical protein HZS_7413 [Henneguya salminicola]|nr:hypothetical protein HZS_7413 [Henneguya salminicola]
MQYNTSNKYQLSLTFSDSFGRSYVKIAPEKYFTNYFVQGRTPNSVGFNANFRHILNYDNAIVHSSKLGRSETLSVNVIPPEIIVQIDECLIRRKRIYNWE